MCLIVDTNVAALVFLQPDKNFRVVHDALFKQRTATVVYGGQLTDECRKSAELRRVLLLLDRAGAARHANDDEVTTQSRKLAADRKCRSNDHHVIALAQLSQVRLLCSDDAKLTEDFKDKALLDRPRGQVYHSSSKQLPGGTRPAPMTAKVLREHCSASAPRK